MDGLLCDSKGQVSFGISIDVFQGKNVLYLTLYVCVGVGGGMVGQEYSAALTISEFSQKVLFQ